MNRDILMQQVDLVNKTIPTTSIYSSPEQTGTGAEQVLAHALGVSPGLVWATLSEGHSGAGAAGIQVPDIAYGAKDATNIRFTVTAGAKYFAFAVR